MMKVARPCPRCGEVTLADKCGKCGYEFMPEVPPPKLGGEKKPKKKGRFLKF